MKKEFKKGMTGTYIRDYRDVFTLLCVIPKSVALAWVKNNCPEVELFPGIRGKDLTEENMVENAWLNKGFIVVEDTGDNLIAISNQDGTFYLYT